MNSDYLEITKFWGPSNNTILSVCLLNKYQRRALDLGCGSFRNTKYLFNSGFIVDAVDKNQDVKNYLNYFADCPKGLINLKIADYLTINLGKNKYNLVVAQNSLSFNSKNEVRKMIQKIHRALKNEGYLAINLFGLKDYHFGSNTMSFYTKKEVKELISIFKIEKISEMTGEIEKNGQKLLWHTFEIVVQK